MRKAEVLFRGTKAGEITQLDNGSFIFKYFQDWLKDSSKPMISLTLPKRIEPYKSDHLFPFFYHMLPEGSNKQIVCNLNRIDESDDFGILLVTGNSDTIGAVSVKRMDHED